MPELPEVETARARLEKELKGKRIVEVVVDTKDRLAFDRDSARAVKKALEGAKVVGTGRKGKYFWIKLDRRPWPVFHLGMSGNIEFRTAHGFEKGWGGVSMWSERNKKSETDKLPRYCRILLRMSNGTEAAMTDPRRFGRIRLARDPLTEAPVSKLGADPLEDFPKFAALQKMLRSRRAPIKAVLLDQSLFAGVGNWLADEILFQAGISPHRFAKDLSDAQIKKIRACTLAIIRRAVKVEADYRRFPDTWLFPDRWNKGRESYTSRGYEIKHDTIGGRTTAWVPALQT